MGIAKYGPLGPFKGKIGPVFGYESNGKLILRAAPRIVRPRTEKQKAVLQRMSLLSYFFNVITKYLAVGFQLAGKKKGHSANNASKSCNLSRAIRGNYPDQELDYSAVLLSKGNLPVPQGAMVTSVEQGFRFTWTVTEGNSTENRSDRTMMMAFFPELRQAVYLIDGACRAAGEDLLLVPSELKGLEAETYISMITDSRNSISDSVYTGRIRF